MIQPPNDSEKVTHLAPYCLHVLIVALQGFIQVFLSPTWRCRHACRGTFYMPRRCSVTELWPFPHSSQGVPKAAREKFSVPSFPLSLNILKGRVPSYATCRYSNRNDFNKTMNGLKSVHFVDFQHQHQCLALNQIFRFNSLTIGITFSFKDTGHWDIFQSFLGNLPRQSFPENPHRYLGNVCVLAKGCLCARGNQQPRCKSAFP